MDQCLAVWLVAKAYSNYPVPAGPTRVTSTAQSNVRHHPGRSEPALQVGRQRWPFENKDVTLTADQWIERYRRQAEERYRRLDAVLARMNDETGNDSQEPKGSVA